MTMMSYELALAEILRPSADEAAERDLLHATAATARRRVDDEVFAQELSTQRIESSTADLRDGLDLVLQALALPVRRRRHTIDPASPVVSASVIQTEMAQVAQALRGQLVTVAADQIDTAGRTDAAETDLGLPTRDSITDATFAVAGGLAILGSIILAVTA